MSAETEFKLPTVDVLRARDQELLEKYRTLEPGEEEAFKELIEQQREAYKATIIEVKDANTGAENIHVAHSIGNTALHNPMAIHSEGWKTEQK